MEKYGFRPSCVGESETLVIADTKETWVLEIFAVGNEWKPESGKPGAIWAAQRVPDDHTTMIPNWSIIKEINLEDTANFRASSIICKKPLIGVGMIRKVAGFYLAGCLCTYTP